MKQSKNGRQPGARASRPQFSPQLLCRGVRGATVAAENTAAAILAATRELLLALVAANGMRPEEMTSIFFTVSPDLNATYPALAARQLGWLELALLCAQEIAVPDGLGRCIRVLIHWNTSRRPDEIQHVYLHEAVALRPERVTVEQAVSLLGSVRP